MKLSDKIYEMMQQSRKRIIETMRERNITKLNLIMTKEEFAKENGFDLDDEETWESEYSDYKWQEAPYVIFFDKWGNGIDYAVTSVELTEDKNRPFFLRCEAVEEGRDDFHDDEVSFMSMVAVYDAMEEALGMEEEEGKVWVFTAEQAWRGEVADTIVRAFDTEDAARKYLHDFLLDDGGEESIRDYVKSKDWDVEFDEPDLYRAYEEGYYVNNHVELTITKCEIKK